MNDERDWDTLEEFKELIYESYQETVFDVDKYKNIIISYGSSDDLGLLIKDGEPYMDFDSIEELFKAKVFDGKCLNDFDKFYA